MKSFSRKISCIHLLYYYNIIGILTANILKFISPMIYRMVCMDCVLIIQIAYNYLKYLKKWTVCETWIHHNFSDSGIF